ncbi:MAG TPA: C45 family peptidase [Acidobacteriota bacterium]|nr:C45 family peptidase [Acidobacteriota bacterium]
MKRRTFLQRSAMAAGVLFAGPATFAGASVIGQQTTRKELPVVVLEGSPRQRGRIHGESLREKIKELMVLWKEDICRSYEVDDPDRFIKEFLADTDFPAAIRAWTPDLLEEVQGLAEGSGIDFPTMLAFQFGDEEWWYGRNRYYGIEITEADKCSVAGVFDPGTTPVLGQNLDIPTFYDGFQALLHIKHEDSSLESFVPTHVGYVSLNGINNRGIAVVVNALLQLNQCIDGLPVAFVIRGILEQETYEDAVEFVETVKHASGQAYTIGGLNEIACFECSANATPQFIPFEGATRIYHTNDPLVNDDQSIYKRLLAKHPPKYKRYGPGNSEIRLGSLERRLIDPKRRIGLPEIVEALSSRDDPRNPVCRTLEDGGGLTFGCMVMELAQSPVLHYAPGPACCTEFNVYRF